MTRDSLFYKILSAIHIVLFTSILCLGTILLSATILFIPVLGAAFLIGQDVIYKRINITDSIVRTYFKYLKSSMKLIKFIPINLVLYLNFAGMIVATKVSNLMYSVICLCLVAFLIVLMLYVAGYFVYINEQVNIVEVVLSMLLKPFLLITVFVITILCVFFFSGILLVIMLFTGTFFLFVVEVVVFIQMLYYKELIGQLDEEDEFAYLINRQRKKK